MAKRLSDTASLVARSPEGEMERTQRIRKIDNGYLVSDSTYNPRTGVCKSSEKFSVSPPKGFEGMNSSGAVGNEGLADTKSYLGKDV